MFSSFAPKQPETELTEREEKRWNTLAMKWFRNSMEEKPSGSAGDFLQLPFEGEGCRASPIRGTEPLKPPC